MHYEVGTALTLAGELLSFQIPAAIPMDWHPDYQGPVVEFSYDMASDSYRFAGMRHSTAEDWIDEPEASYSPCSPKRTWRPSPISG